MITKTPQVNDHYVMYCANPLMLSHRETPLWLEIKVVAVDDNDVWYRIENGSISRKTSMDIFKGIVCEHKPQPVKPLTIFNKIKFWKKRS